ncbi:MAG: 4Fe-4S binding protein [Armatimonadetes bacterium]|nr:4Fe-4S binding protein [Armatimonadota bacterium]
MVRKIIKIDEEKCNGCGLCVDACAEGAIKIIEGKARLVSESYCDGLGACIGKCPQGAITIEEREADSFDEHKAKEWVAQQLTIQKSGTGFQTPETRNNGQLPCGCPGTNVQILTPTTTSESEQGDVALSSLGNWPVQLRLVPSNAPYFQGANVLLAADCVPFAYSAFHRKMLHGKVLIIGCPKLDDAPYYIEKLTEILAYSDIKSLTVARMEVPCCSGLTRIAQMAVAASGKEIPIKEIIISIRGEEINS